MPSKRLTRKPKMIQVSYLQSQFAKTIEPYLSLSDNLTLKPFFVQFRPELSKPV
jgi:hypothetical protein